MGIRVDKMYTQAELDKAVADEQKRIRNAVSYCLTSPGVIAELAAKWRKEADDDLQKSLEWMSDNAPCRPLPDDSFKMACPGTLESDGRTPQA